MAIRITNSAQNKEGDEWDVSILIPSEEKERYDVHNGSRFWNNSGSTGVVTSITETNDGLAVEGRGEVEWVPGTLATFDKGTASQWALRAARLAVYSPSAGLPGASYQAARRIVDRAQSTKDDDERLRLSRSILEGIKNKSAFTDTLGQLGIKVDDAVNETKEKAKDIAQGVGSAIWPWLVGGMLVLFVLRSR